MNSLYQIKKLDEKNYESWNIQIRSVLVHSGLWSVTSGELKQESVPKAVDWQGLGQKALATLILSVKTSQLAYIKHCVHSFETLIKLRDVHQPKGPVRKVALYKKLLGLRMEDGQSISSHINDFIGILDQLAAIGIAVDDDLRGI